MEAIAIKTEKEKLKELDNFLADVPLSDDETGEGNSSVSSASDAATPIPYHQAPSGSCQDRTMRSPRAWCPSTSAGNVRSEIQRGTLNSGLSSSVENSAQQNAIPARRKSRRKSGYDRTDFQHAGHDVIVVELRSELERKDILTTSLKRQLDQRRHIEEQTQARSEQHLTAAVAEASVLKKELERTSQLLMDGAVARQQLEQRCSILEQELQQSNARAKELDQEAFEARVEISRVSGELHSRRGTSVIDAEIAFAEEVQRVRVNAKSEVDASREKAGALREALEEETSLLRRACVERNAFREEAEEALETINSLREEVSSWRNRAEKLERLEQTVRTAFPPLHENVHDATQETIKALKQNLVELQESLFMAREDAITSRGVAAEEKVKRAEAEARLEAMEVEAKAGAKAAREMIWTRRIAELKIAMKEEICAEMDRMRSELKAENDALIEEQRLKMQKLGEELQRSEREKARLERSVKKHFDREKAIELEHRRALQGIQELHDSTMAIVLEAGINMAG